MIKSRDALLASLFGEQYKSCSFGNFIVSTDSEDRAGFFDTYNEHAPEYDAPLYTGEVLDDMGSYRHTLEYVAKTLNPENANYRIFISGPSGCGKTHLAAAIVRECAINGITNFYSISAYKFVELMRDIASSHGSNKDAEYQNRWQLIKALKGPTVLIIEDIGATTVRSAADQMYFEWLFGEICSQESILIVTSSVPKHQLSGAKILSAKAVDQLNTPPSKSVMFISEMPSFRVAMGIVSTVKEMGEY